MEIIHSKLKRRKVGSGKKEVEIEIPGDDFDARVVESGGPPLLLSCGYAWKSKGEIVNSQRIR